MTQKQKNLVGGISVRGIAGLVCKVVGVMYRIPLASGIGAQGIGIYQQVFPSYNLMLTVSSAGIPGGFIHSASCLTALLTLLLTVPSATPSISAASA